MLTSPLLRMTPRQGQFVERFAPIFASLITLAMLNTNFWLSQYIHLPTFALANVIHYIPKITNRNRVFPSGVILHQSVCTGVVLLIMLAAISSFNYHSFGGKVSGADKSFPKYVFPVCCQTELFIAMETEKKR